ncbi:MAG: hypothetical protein IPM42_01450 [Saprospiraceae bacterium]|nr:hypothetical protein [Saprospiraceae bacterium]
MKNWIVLLLFSLNVSLFAQTKDIEVIEREGKGGLDLFAKNNTKDELEATIDMTLMGYVRKAGTNPTTLKLEAGEEKFLGTLIMPPNTDCGYQTAVSYKKLKSSKTIETDGTGMKKRFTSIQMNPVKINVFTQDGCGRCEFVINYLETNKIPYTELNTTIHTPNQELMFEQLTNAGFKGSSVKMPVVVYNGKTQYDIKDLNKFVEGLK